MVVVAEDGEGIGVLCLFVTVAEHTKSHKMRRSYFSRFRPIGEVTAK